MKKKWSIKKPAFVVKCIHVIAQIYRHLGIAISINGDTISFEHR